jgi:hypothetical protein
MKSVGLRFLFLVPFLAGFSLSLSAQEKLNLPVREITLDELVSLSRQNNLVLKMAQSDSAIAIEDIHTARSARSPYITIGGYYNYISDPVMYKGFLFGRHHIRLLSSPI